MERIDELLNELEAELFRAKKAAFSAGEVVLNKREILSLIDRLRAALPDALREAALIVADRDNIKQDAIDFANETIANAEAKAAELVKKESILEQAERQADAMIKEAADYCLSKENEARYKIDCLLREAEEYLTRAVLTIRQNRDEIRNN
ncbi:MAG TPA: hypothetical protein P5161_03525 [Eubacteriales bacterium]|jgi:cell division septum initiation protein DivIVA|nr:hypothetical protein [Clostridia bacterium]HRR89828.1 hypothetical protein [Eubacteriales bacterium]HRU84397.1 hypothetical protein [Eubacteriales bacterium]